MVRNFKYASRLLSMGKNAQNSRWNPKDLSSFQYLYFLRQTEGGSSMQFLRETYHVLAQCEVVCSVLWSRVTCEITSWYDFGKPANSQKKMYYKINGIPNERFTARYCLHLWNSYI